MTSKFVFKTYRFNYYKFTVGGGDSVSKGILNGTSMRLQYLGQCPTTDFVAWNHVGTNHLDHMEIQEESIPETFTNTITRLTY